MILLKIGYSYRNLIFFEMQKKISYRKHFFCLNWYSFNKFDNMKIELKCFSKHCILFSICFLPNKTVISFSFQYNCVKNIYMTYTCRSFILLHSFIHSVYNMLWISFKKILIIPYVSLCFYLNTYHKNDL